MPPCFAARPFTFTGLACSPAPLQCGGSEATIQAALPLLASMGRRALHMGQRQGMGQVSLMSDRGFTPRALLQLHVRHAGGLRGRRQTWPPHAHPQVSRNAAAIAQAQLLLSCNHFAWHLQQVARLPSQFDTQSVCVVACGHRLILCPAPAGLTLTTTLSGGQAVQQPGLWH